MKKEVIEMTIGKKIKDLRLKYDMTQEELATAAETTKQTIHKYETGIIENIPASKIKAIADKLKTTPAYLMGWQDEENNMVKKNDAIADIIIRLRSDDDFLKVVEGIKELSPEQLTAVKTFLSAFNI
jgi:transcriptional regulator with XRE-family HTH domain